MKIRNRYKIEAAGVKDCNCCKSEYKCRQWKHWTLDICSSFQENESSSFNFSFHWKTLFKAFITYNVKNCHASEYSKKFNWVLYSKNISYYIISFNKIAHIDAFIFLDIFQSSIKWMGSLNKKWSSFVHWWNCHYKTFKSQKISLFDPIFWPNLKVNFHRQYSMKN